MKINSLNEAREHADCGVKILRELKEIEPQNDEWAQLLSRGEIILVEAYPEETNAKLKATHCLHPLEPVLL